MGVNVEIIIPTLWANDLLDRCLAALDAHAPGVPVSVSGAGQAATFAENCNRAAQQSAADYLLFLNDDTEVHEGFLAPLVSAFEHHPNTAAAGSKLVYPDGRIQHAGVYLTYDRWSGLVAGNHFHEHRPAGVVQAVTAASMLVQANRFHAVGGFDEQFRNGNEDVDLCLKFNQAGWEVRYAPTSVVTHLESASGAARWAHVGQNISLLSQRWGPLLASEAASVR